MAITDAGMRAFRSAATLADVLPRARIQIRGGDRVLVTVTRTPSAGGDDGLLLAPCAFRASVARAYRLFRQGANFQFLDLAADREPSIHVGLPAGDAALPGSIYRVATGMDRHLFVFITGLTVAQCREAISVAVTTADDLDDFGDPLGPAGMLARRVGLHDDAVTGLTAVHTVAEQRHSATAQTLMTRLLEICVTTEIIAAVTAAPRPS